MFGFLIFIGVLSTALFSFMFSTILGFVPSDTKVRMFGFFVFVAVLSSVLSFFIRQRYSYWQRYNVPFVKPTFPFGSALLFKKDSSVGQEVSKLYLNKKTDRPILGFYFFLYPITMLVDVKLIRSVLVKDFKCFRSRGVYYNEEVDPLSANLVSVEYDKWRPLRTKFSAVFSTGNMKFIFPTIVALGNKLVDYLSEAIETSCEVEIRDIVARFTTDSNACTFGIECDSLRDPDTIFRKMFKKTFDEPKFNFLKNSLALFYAKWFKLFGTRVHHKDAADFFTDIIHKTIKHRAENEAHHTDLLDSLIQSKDLRNATMDEIVANTFAFFMGGFETSSLALTYCLYELALEKNKHIQERARNEIRSVLMQHDGNLTYEALAEMKYCEQIVYETLRKHPPAASIVRAANESYDVPNTNYKIRKGMIVFLSVLGIHHDPAYYPDPEEFIPERFSPEEVKKRPPCTFLAFGDGPRKCIASKFGMLQVRAALVCLLQNFEFSTCSRTEIPLKFCPKKLILSPKGDIWLAIKRIKDT